MGHWAGLSIDGVFHRPTTKCRPRLSWTSGTKIKIYPRHWKKRIKAKANLLLHHHFTIWKWQTRLHNLEVSLRRHCLFSKSGFGCVFLSTEKQKAPFGAFRLTVKHYLSLFVFQSRITCGEHNLNITR